MPIGKGPAGLLLRSILQALGHASEESGRSPSAAASSCVAAESPDTLRYFYDVVYKAVRVALCLGSPVAMPDPLSIGAGLLTW